MSKVSVTYIAPEDDNAVVTMGGVRFFDGQAQKLDSADHALLLSKLRSNQHFKVTDKGAEKEPAKPVVDPDKEPTEDVLEAVHRGRGVYAIVKGDEVLKEGLSKEDSDAFNAMSDEDKAEYVK